MNAVDLIATKRDGGALTGDEIRWLMDGYTVGHVADEQMAAMLMAVYLNGLDHGELQAWTAAMIDSGRRLRFDDLTRPTVDKHSTGGVGDKVSLVLCPLVAACGAAVPQVAGRGLGHTGGTLDKLAAIPGWRAELSPAEVHERLSTVGMVMCAAGPDIAPADRKLYALRDATATVASIPLIASSIMSKKIAEGTDALVLDVKVGTGAFMTDVASARQLAETMVSIGEASGVATRALLTEMSVPLGRAVGNALEVTEAVACFSGDGPSDLVELTLALAHEMLDLVGLDIDATEVLTDGRARATWNASIAAQDGDPNAPLPTAAHRHVVRAKRTGYLSRLDALAVGSAAWRLGAGRARQDHSVSYSAGVMCLSKPGEAVEKGQPVLELHLDDLERLPAALQALQGAIDIEAEPPPPRPLILERIA